MALADDLFNPFFKLGQTLGLKTWEFSKYEEMAIGLKRVNKLPLERIEQMYREQKGRCNLCGKKLLTQDIEVDHIIPISWPGGTDFTFNKALVHKSCNRKKGNRSIGLPR